jgi:hypothetical protein
MVDDYYDWFVVGLRAESMCTFFNQQWMPQAGAGASDDQLWLLQR